MRIKDMPASPAYLVFHDAYDGGAMDVYPVADAWPESALAVAKTGATKKQE